MRGNELTLLIDGQIVLETTDNRFLAGGGAGLWSSGTQITVERFAVIALTDEES